MNTEKPKPYSKFAAGQRVYWLADIGRERTGTFIQAIPDQGLALVAIEIDNLGMKQTIRTRVPYLHLYAELGE